METVECLQNSQKLNNSIDEHQIRFYYCIEFQHFASSGEIFVLFKVWFFVAQTLVKNCASSSIELKE